MDLESKNICISLMDRLREDEATYAYFCGPAIEAITDETEKQLYLTLIPQPRDLESIRRNLESNLYNSMDQFRCDVELCYENAKTYCKKKYKFIYDAAQSCMKNFKAAFHRALSKKRLSEHHQLTVLEPPVDDYIEGCRLLLKELAGYNEVTKSICRNPIDFDTLKDYNTLIPNPMYLSLVEDRLNGISKEPFAKYSSINEISLDIRRTFANLIRYNFSNAKLRRSGIAAIVRFETLRTGLENIVAKKFPTAFWNRLLPQYSSCLDAIDDILKLQSSVKGVLAVSAFMNPVEKLLTPEAFLEYIAINPKPMDYGTIISNLIEGIYINIEELQDDVKLVTKNCINYWSNFADDPTGPILIKTASELENVFLQSLESKCQLKETNPNPDNCNPDSAPDISVKAMKNNSSVVTHNVEKPKQNCTNKLPSEVLLDALKLIFDELKKHYLVSPTGLQIFTATPFLKAVDPLQFPDYALIINYPMNISMMSKRANNGKYKNFDTAMDDMKLLHQNAYTYNSDAESIELRIMADALQDYFLYLVKQSCDDILQFGNKALISSLVTERCYELMQMGDSEYVYRYHESVFAQTGVRPEFHLQQEIFGKNFDHVLLSQRHIPPAIESIVPRKRSTKRKIVEIENDEYDYDYNDDASIKDEVVADVLENDETSESKYQPMNKRAKVIQVEEDISVEDDVEEDKPEWVNSCHNILNALSKHPFIDTNVKSVLADFFVPVSETYPHLATSYLSIVKRPMDLSTLEYLLNARTIENVNDFLSKLTDIFQNAVDFSESQMGEEISENDGVLKFRIMRFQYLVRYVRYLSLELVAHHESSMSDELLTARADRERYMNDQLIDRSMNSAGIRECDKLLKQIKGSRNNAEKAQMECFLFPVDETQLTDYSVYVRKPMDLSTIKYRLDGTLPPLSSRPESATVTKLIKQHSEYNFYGEFVEDLKRIFDNAIKYNSVHRDSDTTGVSQYVYDAAIAMRSKLDTWLPDFTLRLYDKLERQRIQYEEENERHSKKFDDDVDIEAEVAAFEEKEKKRLLAEDELFAVDLDKQKRKEQTREQILAGRIAKQQMKEHAIKSDNVEDVGHDMIDDVYQNTEVGSALIGESNEENAMIVEEKRLKLLSEKLRIPLIFVQVFETKMKARESAWRKWEPTAIKRVNISNHSDSIKTERVNSIEERSWIEVGPIENQILQQSNNIAFKMSVMKIKK